MYIKVFTKHTPLTKIIVNIIIKLLYFRFIYIYFFYINIKIIIYIFYIMITQKKVIKPKVIKPKIQKVEKVPKVVKPKVVKAKLPKETKIKFNIIKCTDAYEFDKLPDMNNADNYNFVLDKLKNSEKRYNNNNIKKMEDEIDFFCSLVYFYPTNKKSDVVVEYNNDFIYSLNVKIKEITFELCEKLVNDICKISENKKSYFIKDTHMEEFIKKNKTKFENKYTLYYLKIKTKDTLIKLLNNKYKICDDAILKILENYYKTINDNLVNINDEKRELIITNIFSIVEFYEILNKSIWIKSQGELYSLITLILLLNSAIQINKKEIKNPLSVYKLEIDFYISEYGLAIEIDGKHHSENEKTKKNDILKNILLDNGEINLIRIEWKNIPENFYDNLYTKLNDFYFKKYKQNLNITKIDYLKILEHINKNIEFPTFSYKYTIKNLPPENFKLNIQKEIIDMFDIKLYRHNNLIKNMDNYDKLIEENNKKIENIIIK